MKKLCNVTFFFILRRLEIKSNDFQLNIAFFPPWAYKNPIST